mgnify:CR=1 FL=1
MMTLTFLMDDGRDGGDEWVYCRSLSKHLQFVVTYRNTFFPIYNLLFMLD